MSTKYTLDSHISVLPGVGQTRAKQLEKMGINTVEDLMFFMPRAYEKRGDVSLLGRADTENNRSYILTVSSEVSSVRVKSGITLSKFKAFDDSGTIEIVFFNAPYVKDVFHTGAVFRFFGKLSFSKRRLQFVNPKYEPVIEGLSLEDFIPVYPSSSGLSSKVIYKYVKLAIDGALSEVRDPLPEYIRVNQNLPTLQYAVKNLHFPESDEALSKATCRFAFDEMLYFGLGISLSLNHNRGEGVKISPCSVEPFIKSLPYELTLSQKNAVNEIYRDLVFKKSDGTHPPMARILIGDVGCGKTVCAALALYIAVKSGYQCVMMAPTEILARQHYTDLKNNFSELGINVELLLGASTKKEKASLQDRLNCGEAMIVVGTHAIISGKCDFPNLGLIVTDEQHRFGVNQRGFLKEKCDRAHMLVMSATPIPRTLALTLYGDLDVSRITEMPKGRKRVDTYVVDESYRDRLNSFIKNQIAQGGQCYVVCPSIDCNEDGNDLICLDKVNNDGSISYSVSSNLKNAVEYSENLQKVFPDLRIAYMHGRMKPQEKDAVMTEFSNGNIDILVSTTVIEVGVNVQNASLMIVENADRFGLSQLHQLRGRVGRGLRKSYCVLVSDTKSQKSLSRLEVMRTTYDGYEIAEKDLMQRGPGDFFAKNPSDNIRQSGGFNFDFASKNSDIGLFEAAFSEAKALALRDPLLTEPEHVALGVEVRKRINPDNSIFS